MTFFTNPVNSYLLVWFHQVVELDAPDAGYLLLIGQITDGLATPVVRLEITIFFIRKNFSYLK